MGKVLTFHDGTQATFTDNSTITNLQTVLGTYAEVDPLRAKFTELNLEVVDFNGTEYKDLVPVSCNAIALPGENVSVSFINKFKDDARIAELEQQVAELEAENAELINENEQLSDKAEAADILLGNEEVE